MRKSIESSVSSLEIACVSLTLLPEGDGVVAYRVKTPLEAC